MDVLDVCRVVHEANRAYCETLEDGSQIPWDEAPAWQKDSAELGVKAKLANPEMTAEDLHVSWMKEKIREGWTYGPVKNPEAKQHPCLLEYSLLPEDQRIKDHLFGAIVLALRPFVTY